MSVQLEALKEAYSKIEVAIIDTPAKDRKGYDVHINTIIVGQRNTLDEATNQMLPLYPKGTVCIVASKMIMDALSVGELTAVTMPEVATGISGDYENYVQVWEDDEIPLAVSEHMDKHIIAVIGIIGKTALYKAVMAASNAVVGIDHHPATLEEVTEGFDQHFVDVFVPNDTDASENLDELAAILRTRIPQMNH